MLSGERVASGFCNMAEGLFCLGVIQFGIFSYFLLTSTHSIPRVVPHRVLQHVRRFDLIRCYPG
jgi:hypothetical protein